MPTRVRVTATVMLLHGVLEVVMGVGCFLALPTMLRAGVGAGIPAPEIGRASCRERV